MRKTIIGIAVFAISLVACNSSSNKSNGSQPKDEDSIEAQAKNEATRGTVSIKEIVNSYLHVKNALANDNGNDAAIGGKAILDAVGKFDTSSLSSQQKKVYDDVTDDIKDNAEHISQNSGNIAHQRQHFEMLSQDMYDLAKAFAGGPPLYKDYCPMYNNGKGATWISETREIKNPYLGKKMSGCGEVKDEIK